MDTNNYQDVNALLRTLSAYGPSLLQPQQHLQSVQEQQSSDVATPPNDAEYDPFSAGNAWSSIPEQAAQASAYQAEATSAYQPQVFEAATQQLRSLSNTPSDLSHVRGQLDARYAHQGYQSHHPSQPQQVSRPSIPTQSVRSTTPALPQPNTPTIDARTITDWPTAIRHITKLSRNPDLGRAIQKLIRNQHDNERQWWAGRQALIEKHKARVTGRKELDDVLKSVGALAGLSGGSREKVGDEKEELRMYDAKVYRAQVQMEKAFAKDLEGLGVPFFGTRVDLIVEDEDAESGQAAKGKKVAKKDLRMLQAKMIQHLEDMYKD